MVRAFNACNDSTADIKLIVSIQNCLIDFTPGTTVSCVQSNITIGNVTAGASSYLWNFGQGAIPATSTLSTPPSIRYNSPGQKTIRLTINAGIAGQELSKEVQIQVNDVPGTAVLTNIETEVCGSKIISLAVNELAGVNRYEWQLPAGWSFSSGSDSAATVNILTTPNGGLLSVRGKNACGSGIPASRTFTTKNENIPIVSISSSGLIICPGNQIDFKFLSSDTTGSISWFLNGEIVAGNKTTKFSSNTFSAGDRIKARINYNFKCLGLVTQSTDEQLVLFSPGPFDKILPVIGELEVCNQDEKTYSVPNIPDYVFNWKLPEGVIIQNGQGSPSVKVKIENLGQPDTIFVTATDKRGCIWPYAESKIQIWEKCGAITIANVFTPSVGDKNSVWLIDGLQDYPNASIKVFNRWGGKVFESKGYTKPWDGTKGGEALPTAAYYYIIDLKDANRTFTGSVTIVR